MNGPDTPLPHASMYPLIFDSVADGLFTVDREWNIMFFNAAASAVTGVPSEEAVGRKCWEVFKTSRCRDVCVLRACIADDRRIAHRVMTIRRADGGEVQVSVSASPLKDGQGRVIGGVETFRDLGSGSCAGLALGGGLLEDFHTCDPGLSEVVSILPQIAQSDATVLLLGESGTGKEVFARGIHRLSRRETGPFVGVNCGALPEALMESELFGYKAGAFTDARKDKAGRFQLAQNGTILLDEIGDLPLALQAKILRVLQERSFEPLGGVSSQLADVRVVASTNRDLERMVAEGTFRQDLFYRLNVVSITLPPLRARLGDLPRLVENILARRRAADGKDIQGVTPEVLRLLKSYAFPGNIRELENIIEYGGILCPGGLIGVEHLPGHLRPAPGLTPGADRGMTMEDIRYQATQRAVARNQGNRNAACRELEISKDTLRRILRRGETDE